MNFTAVIAVVATALSLVFIWPQVWRLRGGRSVDGLSVLGTLQGGSGNALWAAYGILRMNPAVITANVSTVIAIALIARAQVRAGVMPRRWVASVVFGLVAVIALFSMTLGAWAIGLLAFACSCTAITPQLITTLRQPDRLEGVSVPTYRLVTITASAWGLYGMLIGDALVVLPNVIIMPAALVIAQRAARYQTTATAFDGLTA